MRPKLKPSLSLSSAASLPALRTELRSVRFRRCGETAREAKRETERISEEKQLPFSRLLRREKQSTAKKMVLVLFRLHSFRFNKRAEIKAERIRASNYPA